MDDFDLGIGDLSLGAPPASYVEEFDTENETMRQARLRQISTMPPGPAKEAALAAMLRDHTRAKEEIDAERARGEAMMDTPAAKGTHLGGRYSTYVAASPLEHLATALRTYGGAKKIREANAAEELRRQQDEENRKRMMMATTGGGTKYGMYDRL